MSSTFRLFTKTLPLPLFNKRLSGLPGFIAINYYTGLIGTYKRAPQRDLHHIHKSQPVCFGNHLTPWNSNQRSRTYTNTDKIFRPYSSQADSGSLGDLVYQGRVRKMLKTLKVFSLSTSAIGLAVQPYMWITLQNMSLAAAVPLFTVINSFVFVNPFLIHYISKKYVIEMYFNPETKVFTAHVLTFFARKETLTFTADDVDVPDIPNMFAMFNVKGRPLFAHESDFKDIHVYKHLMGFDKPLNFNYFPEDIKDSIPLQDEKKGPV